MVLCILFCRKNLIQNNQFSDVCNAIKKSLDVFEKTLFAENELFGPEFVLESISLVNSSLELPYAMDNLEKKEKSKKKALKLHSLKGNFTCCGCYPNQRRERYKLSVFISPCPKITCSCFVR